MRGAALSASYAFPPNSYGYCGQGSFMRMLRSFLAGDADQKDLEKGLVGFPAHHSYLSLIARENGRKPFDDGVVKALWIGNKLLDNVPHDSIRRFITGDLFAGTQKKRAERLAKQLPEGILPHHSMNALYVRFVTNKVERSVKSYDSCCVTAGEILSVSHGSAIVKRWCVGWDDGFHIGEKKDRIALERKGIRLLDGLRRGDLVSVHWGMAVQRIGIKDFNTLKRYTQRNIDAINEAV